MNKPLDQDQKESRSSAECNEDLERSSRGRVISYTDNQIWSGSSLT